MTEQRALWCAYNDGYKEAMVFLVAYGVTPDDGEPEGAPTLEVEYDLPAPQIQAPDGSPAQPSSGKPVAVKPKKQTQKLGVTYYAADPPTPQYLGQIYGGFEQLYFAGTVRLKVRWKSKSGREFEATHSFGAKDILNKPATMTVSQTPVALTDVLVSPILPEEEGSCTVTTYPQSPDNDTRAAIVSDILVHLDRSLRTGLGDLWRRLDPKGCCYNGSALRDHDFSTGGLDREQLLECWAQHVTELLIGGPYLGAATNMGVPNAAGIAGSHGQDAFLAQACVSGPRLLVPLMFECQQLATMTLLCLGFDSLAQNPLDSHNVAVGNLPGKTTLTVSSNTTELSEWLYDDWPSAKVEVDRKLARVGTCYYVTGDGGTPGATGDDYPHIAATLRVGRTPAKLQLLDTGGWIWDAAARLGARSGGGGYMYDTPWVSKLKKDDKVDKDPVTHQVTKTTKFHFEGVMQPPIVASSDLVRAIERMRTASIVGAARLIIKDRRTGAVWWMSQLLPMEYNNVPYSWSRLLASLRGCPHRSHVEVTWQVVVPCAPQPERVLWDRSRSPSAALSIAESQILADCSTKNCLEGTPAWWGTGALLPLAAISIGASGGPFFAQKATRTTLYSNQPFRPRQPGTDSRAFDFGSETEAEDFRRNMHLPQFTYLASQAPRVTGYFRGRAS